ncbi:MAG: PASTA domain-containing protein [Clostridiales bacterium]|nr:PASTA domain-containing protein [Clostridiales bacterium]
MSKRCLGCMEIFEDDFEVCPKCGFVAGQPAEEPIHMNPGTLLHDRYIIGKVLGFGGFGATYLAWDELLERKVAIKEYLPSEFSTRVVGKTEVTVFAGEKSEQFTAGMNKFTEEANRLGLFQNEPGIIKIFDTFEENNTAYNVMEYLEGETLAARLKREKTIPEDEAVELLMPVMLSLKAVHEEGILHRDIAPENIFITNSGEVKLIDFGASRFATTSYSRSLTVIIKQGYSPEEQYRSRGDQGKHTDVYALAATLYKMITGKTPPDAMERRAKYERKSKDILIEPHKLTDDISRAHEIAILNALNVRIEDRTPDISTFIKELNADPPAKRIYGKIKKIDLYAWPMWVKILIPTVLVALLTFGILLLVGVIDFSKYSKEVIVPDSIVIAPDVEGMRQQEALEAVKAASLNASISGNIESDYISPGKIMTQTPVGGAFVERNGAVYLVVSSGNGVIAPYNGISTVPYLVGDTREAAIEKCKKAGLGETKFEEVYDENVMAGLVISSTPDGGEEVAEGSPITIRISKGQESFPMPDVVGKDLSAAQQMLSDAGLMVSVEYALSDTVEEDHVISQSIAANTPITRGEQVTIVIATKEELVKVPNVVGHPQKDAEDTLKELSFEVNVIQSFDPSVPLGYVINQDPKADSSQKKGVRVTIIVSKGPEPTPTPAPGTTPGAVITPVPGVTLAPGVNPAPGNGPIYKLTFNANGGTSTEKERQVASNVACGQLPSATRDYYHFDGWYTSANGGTQISSSTTISAPTTVYAHWTENPISDWILADKAPTNAQIVDTKWTYTETKESEEADLDGWTLEEKEISGYKPEEGPVLKDPTQGDRKVYGPRHEGVEVHYIEYYHMHGRYEGFYNGQPVREYQCVGPYDAYAMSPDPDYAHDIQTLLRVYEEFEYVGLDTRFEGGYNKGGFKCYKGPACPVCGDSNHWYVNFEQWRMEWLDVWYYQDPIYSYHYKRVVEDATSDPTGKPNVSDVKKYVKYRAK